MACDVVEQQAMKQLRWQIIMTESTARPSVLKTLGEATKGWTRFSSRKGKHLTVLLSSSEAESIDKELAFPPDRLRRLIFP